MLEYLKDFWQFLKNVWHLLIGTDTNIVMPQIVYPPLPPLILPPITPINFTLMDMPTLTLHLSVFNHAALLKDQAPIVIANPDPVPEEQSMRKYSEGVQIPRNFFSKYQDFDFTAPTKHSVVGGDFVMFVPARDKASHDRLQSQLTP